MAKSSNKNIKKINAQLSKSSNGKKVTTKNKKNVKSKNSKSSKSVKNTKSTKTAKTVKSNNSSNYKKNTSVKNSKSNKKNTKIKYTRKKKKDLSKVVLEEEKELLDKVVNTKDLIDDYTFTKTREEFFGESEKEFDEAIDSLTLETKAEEIVDDIINDNETDDSVTNDSTLDLDNETSKSYDKSDTTKYDELVDELKTLYENDNDLEKDNEELEKVLDITTTTIEVLDESGPRYTLGEKILNWTVNILYIIFVLLVIALIALIIYVCTY